MWHWTDATIDGEAGPGNGPRPSADVDGVQDAARTGGRTFADEGVTPVPCSPVAPRVALVSRPLIMPGSGE